MPVVAGTFYPSDADELRQMVGTYLEQAAPQERYRDVLGVVSPHAGYVYSGLGAGYAFRALQGKAIDTAVVLAPSHRVGGFVVSVGNYDAYRTPLGDVPVDREAVQALLSQDGICFAPQAHSGEHSLEVQLPFLMLSQPKARLVPLVLGHQTDDHSRWLAGVLASVFGSAMERTAFIASSDLSHYHDSDTARTLDMRFAHHVEKLDTEGLMDDIAGHRCEACGFGGVLTLMHLAKMLGYAKNDTLTYFHSGDVSGDNRQVVGYMASVFYR